MKTSKRQKRCGTVQESSTGQATGGTGNRPTYGQDTLSIILESREKTHGDFGNVAAAAQTLKSCFREFGSERIRLEQQESLDMIASKIARILCGNPDEPDHWIDIAGYAKLSTDRLK